jgi:hypothetical protein
VHNCHCMLSALDRNILYCMYLRIIAGCTLSNKQMWNYSTWLPINLLSSLLTVLLSTIVNLIFFQLNRFCTAVQFCQFYVLPNKQILFHWVHDCQFTDDSCSCHAPNKWKIVPTKRELDMFSSSNFRGGGAGSHLMKWSDSAYSSAVFLALPNV